MKGLGADVVEVLFLAVPSAEPKTSTREMVLRVKSDPRRSSYGVGLKTNWKPTSFDELLKPRTPTVSLAQTTVKNPGEFSVLPLTVTKK